jgi:hypothetical protein
LLLVNDEAFRDCSIDVRDQFTLQEAISPSRTGDQDLRTLREQGGSDRTADGRSRFVDYCILFLSSMIAISFNA